jgi:hypothetical protein
VTDPRGCCFLSYRRARADEVNDLDRRLRRRGIPVWVDISDLGPGSTEDQIRDALLDPSCASAVAWITPEVADSQVIRRVEVPTIVQRINAGDAFFGVFVAAGGLDYADAARVAAENLGVDDLRFWNQHKIGSDPATQDEIVRVADRVLEQRLKRIAAEVPPNGDVLIGVWVRQAPPATDYGDLELDWSESFTGRSATSGAWEAELLPALSSVERAVGRHLTDRVVVLHGHPTLAVATAVGRAFPAVAATAIRWEQRRPDGSRERWSLQEPAADSGFSVRSRALDPSGDGLAVMVSVLTDVSAAIGATSGLPTMRAAVEVAPADDRWRPKLTAGGARQLADDIAEAVRSARSDYRGVKEIHLFMAAPAGLAVLLGQLLNAVGPITVYEHIDADAVGSYRPEVRLPGSGIGGI